MRLMQRQSERGQVLPLWIVAIITTFALMFLAINYGNTIRWQMRAQNAADGAAQALMAIQTERFNELTAALYASNIEEFRIRRLLDGMLNALNGAGGCTGQPHPTGDPSGAPTLAYHPWDTSATTSCDYTFNTLLTAYVRAVNRYTVDVQKVNDVSSAASFSNWTHDATNLLAHLKSNCNDVSTTAVKAAGGDCQFKYTLIATKARTGLHAVAADAYVVFVPTQGFTLTDDAETENPNYFEPGMVDIVTCTEVPPLIPAFAAINANSHYVLGRAGATAVLTEEDWLQPGYLNDPVRGNGNDIPFQPYENYVPADAPSSGLTYDWYGVYYGGNSWQTNPFVYNGQDKYGYTSTPTINDLSAYDGWWNAIPYDPKNVDNGAGINPANDC
jgi:hypothetical protein